ncbi:unnamed protein product, partial [Prorocentrum cordatum]
DQQTLRQALESQSALRLAGEEWLDRAGHALWALEARPGAVAELRRAARARDRRALEAALEAAAVCEAQIGSGHLTEQRRRERDGYIFGNLAQGTQTAYSTAWQQWLYFMREVEEVLLEWIAHQARRGRSEGTIRGKLLAARRFHVEFGRPDPLELAPRVWLALGGLRRTGAKRNWKYPVTIEMLSWLYKKFNTWKVGDASLWAAIAVAFFFMLSASEYLADPGKP